MLEADSFNFLLYHTENENKAVAQPLKTTIQISTSSSSREVFKVISSLLFPSYEGVGLGEREKEREKERGKELPPLFVCQ